MIWFKGLSEGWRTITILSGFVIAVATAAVAIDHFKTKVSDAGAVIVYLQKARTESDKREHVKDSIDAKRYNEIDFHLGHISDSLRYEFESQKTFQDNYSRFVSVKTGSVQEWMKYMEGMQVTIVQSPPGTSKSLNDKPNFKIHIVPIK